MNGIQCHGEAQRLTEVAEMSVSSSGNMGGHMMQSAKVMICRNISSRVVEMW